jgi:hypothetical protein
LIESAVKIQSLYLNITLLTRLVKEAQHFIRNNGIMLFGIFQAISQNVSLGLKRRMPERAKSAGKPMKTRKQV